MCKANIKIQQQEINFRYIYIKIYLENKNKIRNGMEIVYSLNEISIKIKKKLDIGFLNIVCDFFLCAGSQVQVEVNKWF